MLLGLSMSQEKYNARSRKEASLALRSDIVSKRCKNDIIWSGKKAELASPDLAATLSLVIAFITLFLTLTLDEYLSHT